MVLLPNGNFTNLGEIFPMEYFTQITQNCWSTYGNFYKTFYFILRQTKWGVNPSGVGISHTGNFFDNDNHRLDGTVSLGKNWNSQGLRPDQLGGRLDYNHKPSGSSAFVGANNIRGYGTDVNAGLKYNILQGKNYGVDLTGQYGRHYGGPGGTGSPNSGVFLNLNGKFWVKIWNM